MWISTKQTKHNLVSRRSFTAWAAVQNSAVINNSERRKDDENREKTTHRITFNALHRSLGARANSPAPHSLSSQKKTAVPQKNSRPIFSVDMYLKSDHKQVQEISTSLFVSPYRRIEPC